MAKKRQIGLLGATAIAMATMMGGAQQVNVQAPAQSQNQNQKPSKEAIPEERKQIKPVAIKNRHGGFSGEQNPYKHLRKGSMNQQKWRKWKRSNPNSKKHQ